MGLALASLTATAAPLDLARLGIARQNDDAATTSPAARAIDGQPTTFSVTAEAPDAFWECELRRPYLLSRIEIVASTDLLHTGATDGLVLEVHDLRDRVLFTSPVSDPGPGGIWAVDLPGQVAGRILRVRLANGRPNGAGKQQVVLAEVRALGDPSVAFGPLDLPAVGSAWQSSNAGAASLAAKAVDGDPASFSQTADLANSAWVLTLDRVRPLHRIEVVNRRDCCSARLAGLTLRILDDQSNTVAQATITDPGLGAVWGFDAPPGTRGRHVWIGLEAGRANGGGDRVVSLAEVTVLTAPNLALNREAYMVRYQDSLPPASNANDGNYATETRTTEASVDGYWEVDLGETQALDSVRVVAATGFGPRLSHATVRLFDAAHDSVFAQHLAGNGPTFDVDVAGPVLARYVRVGFENKERSHATGGIEWYLGLKEVQAFGRSADAVGLRAFAVTRDRLAPGESTTLTWLVEGLQNLQLHPAGGSMGAFTQPDGTGALTLTPSASVEYVLVGTSRHGPEVRAVTVRVDDRPLPVQISEFVAANRWSFRDGRKEAPDWVELHNPNNDPVALAGYGLSDDPADPMKWRFPAVSIPPHGYLVVCASGRNAPFDAAGVLHANFQLAAEGESLVLTAPDGVSVADGILRFPPQREDLAYGRTLDGRWTFMDPTPGGPNLAATYDGWLAPPVFSHPRGFQTNAFHLTLTQPDAEAELLFSLDGREPNVPYLEPLLISSPVSVRATVHRPGFKSPRTVTHSYVFVERVMAAGSMNQTLVRNARFTDRIRRGLTDLPTLAIAVPQLPDDYNEREASVEIFWPDGAPPVQANCGVFRFGGAWTTFSKKNYRLKFRRDYGAPKLEAPLFRGFDRGFLARESFDEIDLAGGSHDMLERGFYMAGRFTEDTMLDMGSLNPHGRFVNVYFNGRYWGQYHARERLTDAFLADYLGGETEDYVNVRGNDNVGDNFIPGTPDPRNRAPWETLRARRNSYLQARPYLDVPHLIDFMLMWFYGNCETEYRAAGPIQPGSGFKFWIGDADGYLRTGALTLDSTGNPGPGGLFGALVAEKHPDFMTLLADRIQQHFFLDGALTPARNRARLDERMLEITNSLVAECARWNVRTPDNWESAAQSIRTGLFPGRTTNLLNRLRSRGLYPGLRPPEFNQWGGTVTNGFRLLFSGTGGTIYYTLDGSDPRLPGGGIAPTAQIAAAGGEQTLILPGTTWRYWDQGPPPSPDWASPAFDDRSWPAGPAELGYGDGDESTVLSFGPNANNKHPAAYFRQAFVLPNAAAVTELVVELVRDDGAVVYLNGKELLRDNLPAGVITHTTLASSAVGGAEESQFFNFILPPTHLLTGTNLLAVEVHQASANSTDLSFNLALQARTQAAAAGVSVPDGALVRARSRSGTTWSALVEARFDLAEVRPLAAGDLVISEIHYNPAGSDDYEFVELWNPGTNWVDLGGARLAEGVEFLFPTGFRLGPGAFALVVENEAAFAERYQSPASPYYHPGLTVAGEWSGRLDDSGERLAILTRSLAEVLAVTYRPDGAWPRRADGRGSSLELRAPGDLPADPARWSEHLSQPRHWRPSSLFHGSPGRHDDYRPPVVLNESWAGGDARADWIELHNPGLEAADLTGLYFSDQYDRPFRYAFAEDTLVPPAGYLVLRGEEFGFGLSTAGSDLLLVTGSGTNVLRFVDTADFPAVDRAETCGRYVRLDGTVDFTELRAPTPGAANTLPRVGPIVFSEIMYRPEAGRAEYVELVNVSAQPLLLNDPAQPTNTWTLAGAVTFAFPPGIQLPPCTLLIVCSTNPAAFRTQYGVGAEVAVFGPWTGALNNAGETLRLLRPGPFEAGSTTRWYRSDRVVYEPQEPWPLLPAPGGVSLERVTLEGYGNEAGNWVASAPGGTPGQLPPNRPPLFEITGPGAAEPGETVEWLVQALDPDAPWQIATPRADALPAGSTFDPATGRFLWPLSAQQPLGVYEVAFSATDDSVCPASTTVRVPLLVRTPLVLGWELRPGDATPWFSFEGSAAVRYEVQYTEDLASESWTTLLHFPEPVEGAVEFQDPDPTSSAQRFYRLVEWLASPVNPP